MNEMIQAIGENLARDGYHYDPCFGSNNLSLAQKRDMFVAFASKFGDMYLSENKSVIQTNPQPTAPSSMPFDRNAQIGWHNDFSTKNVRPRISMSWIVNQDPHGPMKGGWRLASARDVITVIRNMDDGVELLARLGQPIFPFGYLERGAVNHFPILEKADGDQMRFYGRALREGAQLDTLRIIAKPELLEIVQIVEEAADMVGYIKPAPQGALMVVDNTRSLHDRLPQTVEGKQPLRTALLSFVV
ncbi:MAG: hypothetical protein HOP23_18430 [Methylococcaceae bacterium]|nr:hypothetical protein [Methylococcaceae bacterium]